MLASKRKHLHQKRTRVHHKRQTTQHRAQTKAQPTPPLTKPSTTEELYGDGHSTHREVRWPNCVPGTYWYRKPAFHLPTDVRVAQAVSRNVVTE